MKCIEPKTGKVMWTLEDGVPCSSLQCPAVHEDLLVCRGDPSGTSGGVQCYRITPRGATLLWQHKVGRTGRCTAPVIHRGRVFVAGRTEPGKIYDLATGRVLENNVGRIGGYAPIVSDGYLIGSGSSAYRRFEPKSPISRFSAGEQAGVKFAREDGGPAVVNGHLYVRGPDRFYCLDLRKRERPAAAAPANDEKPQPGLAGLGVRQFTRRRKAIEALKCKDAVPAAELAKSALEGEWLVRKAAAEILAARGAKAGAVAPQLAAALPGAVRDGSYGQVRLLGETINAIDASAFDAVAKDIAALLTSDDSMVVMRGGTALELMGARAAPLIPQLIAVLKRDDEHLYRYAASALKAIGPAAKAAGPVLAGTVDKSRNSITVPCALDTLRVVGVPPDMLPKLGPDRKLWFRTVVPVGTEAAYPESRTVWEFSFDWRQEEVVHDAFCLCKSKPEGRVEEGSVRFDGPRMEGKVQLTHGSDGKAVVDFDGVVVGDRIFGNVEVREGDGPSRPGRFRDRHS